MFNLENKQSITAYQLALVIVSTSFGGQIVLGMRSIIAEAEQGAWLSIALGGILFGSAALLMVMLGRNFPEKTVADYAPRILGRLGGGLMLFWLILAFFLQLVVLLVGTSRAITLFMFDLTPVEIVGLGLLAVSAYCAVQDFGTILRVTQISFFLQLVLLPVLWLLTLLNFTLDNLLPIFPRKLLPVATGTISTYGMFAGYEIILLLWPLLGKGKDSFSKILGYAFLYLTLIFMWVAVLIIGVMTVEGAKNSTYPTVLAIRAVELPGTFVERLENYLILAWVPAVFDTIAIVLYMNAELCARFFRHRDHRPWVLLITGLIFIAFVLTDNVKAYETVNKVSMWLGIAFSCAVVPAVLALTWWQKRRGYG